MKRNIVFDLSDETKEKIDKYFKEHHIENNIDNKSKFILEAVTLYMAHMIKNN